MRAGVVDATGLAVGLGGGACGTLGRGTAGGAGDVLGATGGPPRTGVTPGSVARAPRFGTIGGTGGSGGRADAPRGGVGAAGNVGAEPAPDGIDAPMRGVNATGRANGVERGFAGGWTPCSGTVPDAWLGRAAGGVRAGGTAGGTIAGVARGSVARPPGLPSGGVRPATPGRGPTIGGVGRAGCNGGGAAGATPIGGVRIGGGAGTAGATPIGGVRIGGGAGAADAG